MYSRNKNVRSTLPNYTVSLQSGAARQGHQRLGKHLDGLSARKGVLAVVEFVVGHTADSLGARAVGARLDLGFALAMKC